MAAQQTTFESLSFRQGRPIDPQQVSNSSFRPLSAIFPPFGFKEPQDPWIEEQNLYEKTLEEMSSANFVQSFKEELNTIQKWYITLSDVEKTAAMYSLLQFSTPVQVRFFVVVLLQLSNKEPTRPALSPDTVEKVEETLKRSPISNVQDKSTISILQQDARNISVGSGIINRSSRRLYNRYSMPVSVPEEAAAFFKSLGQQEDKPTGGSALLNPLETQPQHSNNSQYFPVRPVSHAEAETDPVFTITNAAFRNFVSSNNTSRAVDRRESERPRSFCGIDALGGSRSIAGSFKERPRSTMSEYSSLSTSTWGISTSPSASSWGEYAKAIERPKSAADVDSNGLGLFQWRLANSNKERYENKFERGTCTNSTGLTINVPDVYSSPGANRAPGSAIGRSVYESDIRSPPYSNGLQSPIQSPMFPPNNNSYPGSRPTSPTPPGLFSTNWGRDGMKRHMPQGLHNKQYASMTDNFNDEDYRSDRVSRLNNQRNLAKDNKIQDGVDLELLNDIPAWLRSLRLHKYTPLFEGMKWQDIVRMNDDQLSQKGVAALGARRKMLKVFETILKETGL
ncbi:Flap-structured DNA-binding and RNA-binding protein [Basidiobolus ranarum]|uniref:RNA-binding protein VTS1 n=1 Tax=Basidiobolus ranarum TaxID=34480 RepID=A0ABR2WSA4_9FUNG